MLPTARARRALTCLLATLVVPALLAATPTSSATSAAGPVADDGFTLAPAGPLLGQPLRGSEAIRELGEELEVAAGRNDLRPAELRTLLRSDRTAWVDREGAVFYVEPARSQSPPATATADPVAPLAETFELHSNPGADLTILLDFDGGIVSGTHWNTSYGVTTEALPAWDPAGDGPAFSDGERASVQQIWATVAEDYAPFGVDVTTEDPGADGMVRSSPEDTVYGTTVMVTPSPDVMQDVCGRVCSGISYWDTFDTFGGTYQPVWIFPQALSNTVKFVAEAASHETGHVLGLGHDGIYIEDGEVFDGRGVWAPIMGRGYRKPLVQWSQGSYDESSNTQDDVAILREYLGARADEASDAESNPSMLPDAPAFIGTRQDTDAYLLGSCEPGTVVSVLVEDGTSNLDLRAVLYDPDGVARAVSEPAAGADAGLTVPTGEGWVLEVDGVGDGTWATEGYDDYGSLGAYVVSAAGCDGAPVSGVPSAPLDVAVGPSGLDSLSLTWSAPASEGAGAVTGYVVSRSGTELTQTLDADARSHTFTGLASGTTYLISVRAVNATGAGPSAAFSVSTASPPPVAPSVPRNLEAWYDRYDDMIVLWWDLPEDPGTKPISGYAIYFDDELLGVLKTPYGEAYITSDTGFVTGDHVVGVAAVSSAGFSPVATAVVPAGQAPNDHVDDAVVLTGTSGSVAGDNTYATGAESDPALPIGNAVGDVSVWYSWTPTSAGPVTMSTSGGAADRDPTLAVLTGEPWEWVQVAGDDDSGPGLHASLSFTPTPGTRYLIAVDGLDTPGGRGPFTLSWNQTAPPVPAAAPGRMAKPKVVVRGRNVTVSWGAAPAKPPTLRYLVDLSKGKDRSLPAGARRTVFKAMKPGAYKVRVAARNAVGTSPYSLWVSFRVR